LGFLKFLSPWEHCYKKQLVSFCILITLVKKQYHNYHVIGSNKKDFASWLQVLHLFHCLKISGTWIPTVAITVGALDIKSLIAQRDVELVVNGAKTLLLEDHPQLVRITWITSDRRAHSSDSLLWISSCTLCYCSFLKQRRECWK